MLRIPFNEKLKIGEHLSWDMLKYGLCSYFALAYENKHPSCDSFLAVMEYDEELEKEYLVHFLVINQGVLIDAYGTYTDWRKSVEEITDIEYMELTTKVVDKKFVVDMIDHDMGFDQKLYDTISDFVNNTYY